MIKMKQPLTNKFRGLKNCQITVEKPNKLHKIRNLTQVLNSYKYKQAKIEAGI